MKEIAAAQGNPAEGLKIVEKAKAAVSAVKVAQALDAIANMLDATADGKPAAAAAAEGKALKSVDTLTNLSAYLTLYRWVCGVVDRVGLAVSITVAALTVRKETVSWKSQLAAWAQVTQAMLYDLKWCCAAPCTPPARLHTMTRVMLMTCLYRLHCVLPAACSLLCAGLRHRVGLTPLQWA